MFHHYFVPIIFYLMKNVFPDKTALVGCNCNFYLIAIIPLNPPIGDMLEQCGTASRLYAMGARYRRSRGSINNIENKHRPECKLIGTGGPRGSGRATGILAVLIRHSEAEPTRNIVHSLETGGRGLDGSIGIV